MCPGLGRPDCGYGGVLSVLPLLQEVAICAAVSPSGMEQLTVCRMGAAAVTSP